MEVSAVAGGEGTGWLEKVQLGKKEEERRGLCSGGHRSATVATERPSNLDSKMTLREIGEKLAWSVALEEDTEDGGHPARGQRSSDSAIRRRHKGIQEL